MEFHLMPMHQPLVIIVLLAGLLQPRCALATVTSQEDDTGALGAEVSALSGQALDSVAIRRLITIDQALAKVQVVNVAADQERVLMALATSQVAGALEHVRSVFENAPERRGSAARALAAATTLRPTDLQDWRYMVRSLSVVRGNEAVDVLNALQRFRTRANKGNWVRQVILIGLQLPADQQAAATGLLRHRTGVPLRKPEASDFGLGGSRPSHPELLDWLAGQLQANGWSLKPVHRLICLSATYRQTSNNRSALQRRLAQTTDADNRYLWRQNSRQLDAESLRDAVLTVSAKLSPARNVTTTALQSLALLNNEFILKQADYFAARLAENPDSGPTEQVSLAFRSAFGRQPSTAESTASIALIKSAGLAGFCRALLNANEFVYVD